MTLPFSGVLGAAFGSPVVASSSELRWGMPTIVAAYRTGSRLTLMVFSVMMTSAPAFASRSSARLSAVCSTSTLRCPATTPASFTSVFDEYGQNVPSTGDGR